MNPKTTITIWLAAKQSIEPFYHKYIKEKIIKLGLDPRDIKDNIDLDKESSLIINKESTLIILLGSLYEGILIYYLS